jgi:hypothetical protein
MMNNHFIVHVSVVSVLISGDRQCSFFGEVADIFFLFFYCLYTVSRLYYYDTYYGD